jgi:hypothetical protein
MELPSGTDKYPSVSGLTGPTYSGKAYTDAIRAGATLNGYVIPMLTFLDKLGTDWYWPVGDDFVKMHANIEAINATLANISEGEQLVTNSNGVYWTSRESGVSASTGQTTGYYYNFSSSSNKNTDKSKKYYGRGVKDVTK